MFENSPGYHSPIIQRTYLIPLAEEFVKISLDSSSVDQFVDFVIQKKNPRCEVGNLKNWRKDACKALRLVNARSMFGSTVTAAATTTTVPNGVVPLVSTPESTRSEALSSESAKPISRKRSRLALDTPAPESFTSRLPSLKLSQIKDTTPQEFRNQIKYFLKLHLFIQNQLPIWPTLLVSGPPFCGKTTLIEAACGSLGVKLMTVSVGTVQAGIRPWIDIFNQAKACAPCVLHLDDIEGMEKHTPPVGTFRLTCLLKSQILKEMIGSGLALIGETRSLSASLSQSVLDLFTQKITFGMLAEVHRLNLLGRYLADDPLNDEFLISTSPTEKLQLSDGLSCAELARRTPGYEAGDLIRLVSQLRMTASMSAAAGSTNDDEDDEVDEPDVGEQTPGDRVQSTGFSIGPQNQDDPMPLARRVGFGQSSQSKPLLINRDHVEQSLSLVVPAVKNTAEFVTIPDVTWADVGGLESTKTELYNRFMLLVHDWDRAQALNRRSGGVLLEGPPGCGKTLVAKALSNQAGLNFLSIKGPEVLNKFQGESERRIREIFERARACQPCLVFFDEIDAICPKRDSDESTGSRVSLVNQLLVELDGVDKHRSSRVFVVGATNRKDMIDPAVLRPGRLGLHLQINPPESPLDRLSVMSACTRQATRPRIDGGLDTLATITHDPRTDGMSGADLENLLELAKQKAQLAKQDYLARENLYEALAELAKKS